jgi:hypothetical protein
LEEVEEAAGLIVALDSDAVKTQKILESEGLAIKPFSGTVYQVNGKPISVK